MNLRVIASLVAVVASVVFSTARACDVPDPRQYLDPQSCLADWSPQQCEQAAKEFGETWARGFATGEIEALRQVAQSLTDSPSGVLHKNPVLSCAFRHVIARSGDLNLTAYDLGFVSRDGYCTGQYFSAAERIAFINLSMTIEKTIEASSKSCEQN